jgi:hypothetical protein
MGDNIEVNVDFIINNPQVTADAAKVKADVTGIGDTAEKAVERVNKSVSDILSVAQENTEALSKEFQDLMNMPTKSAKDSYINLLNEDLKLGIITMKEYEQEMLRLSKVVQPTSSSTTASKPKAPAYQFSESYKAAAAEGLQVYNELDPATQQLILRNIDLKDELTAVTAAQKELSEAFESGAVTGSKMSQAQAALAAKEAELKESIKSTTAELKNQAAEAELATARAQNAGKDGFDKLGNAINKPVGQLSRLKYAAEKYAEMSATSYNPEIIAKYNRKLQETEEQIKKTGNMGKEGFDEMGNAVEENEVSISSVYSKGKEIAEMLPGIGLAGILAFATGPILEYLDSLNLFEVEASDAEKAAEKMGSAINSPDYAAAVKNVSELKLNIELAKDGFLAKDKVLHQYNESIGKTTGQVKSLAEAETALQKNADAYIKMTLLKAAAQLALEDAAKSAFEGEQARQNGDVSGREIIKSKNLSVFDKLKSAFVQDANYDKDLIKERTNELVKTAQDAADESEGIAKKFQAKAAQIAKQYKFDFFGGTQDGEKPKDNTEAILNEREGLLSRISDLNAEYARKSKTQDQAEIDAVKDKFNKIIDLVKKFNKENPKRAIDTTEFEQVRDTAVIDLEGQQAVEKAQITIDAQKQIFNQFEQYKLEFGVQKANERFDAELKGYKTFIDYLNSLMPKADDQSAGANAMRDYLSKAIPAAEGEQAKATFDNTTKQLKKVLEATEVAAVKKLAIEKKYNEDLLALNNDKTLGDVEKAARIRKLDEIKVIELKANKQIAFQETEYYKAAMKDVTNASLTELKQRLKEAKKELANANLTPEERAAVQEKYSAAERTLSDKGFKKDEYGQFINQNSKVADQAGMIASYAKAASGSFYEMAGALASTAPDTAATLETLGDIADVAGKAAGAVSSFAKGDIVGGITGTISTIASVFSIGAKARESERKAQEEFKSAQDKIVQGEIALNIEMRARIRTQQDINDLTNVELQARKQMLTTQQGAAKADFEKQLALVQAGQYLTGENRTEKYGGFLGIGKKTRVIYGTAGLEGQKYEQLEALSIAGKLDEATEKLFQDLKKSKAEMDAIGESAEDLAAIITEKLTGGITPDSISNTIIQGFKDGKKAVKDFADDTNEIVQNALLSALAYNTLSEPLKKLVAQFSTDAQDGLDKTEIDAFKTGLGSITDTFLQATDAVEKSTGMKLSGKADTSAATGALKAVLTEDSVNVYIGIARGTYDLQKQDLAISKADAVVFRDQLLSLRAIEANTGRTASNTDGLIGRLDQIINNTKTERSRD